MSKQIFNRTSIFANNKKIITKKYSTISNSNNNSGGMLFPLYGCYVLFCGFSGGVYSYNHNYCGDYNDFLIGTFFGMTLGQIMVPFGIITYPFYKLFVSKN